MSSFISKFLLLLCPDPRFDWFNDNGVEIYKQLKKLLDINFGDPIQLFGASKNLVEIGALREKILWSIGMAIESHKIEGVVITNHWDCAAYGPERKNKDKLIADLKEAKRVIQEKFSDLKVIMVFINLADSPSGWQSECEIVD